MWWEEYNEHEIVNIHDKSRKKYWYNTEIHECNMSTYARNSYHSLIKNFEVHEVNPT